MNDNKDSMFAGGIIIIVVVGALALKAIEKIFIQLGQVFDAMTNAAASFFMMAWHLVLALGLIAVGIGCVYAAVYFTNKYYLMVKRGTDLQQQVNRKLQEVTAELNSAVSQLREDTRYDLRLMAKKLSDALDKPEIVPAKALAKIETTSEQGSYEASEVAQSVDQVGDGEAVLVKDAEEISPRDIANPF